MILIIGGRYQGRTDFARERLGLGEEDIFACGKDTAAPDLSARCLSHIEDFVLNRVRAGEDPLAWFIAHGDALAGKAIIATDISCGVVPVDPEARAWREANGRVNRWLAGRADEVWRLFCGLPQRLK